MNSKAIESPNTPTPAPTVQHLIHVICLPLQLKHKQGGRDQPVRSLDELAYSLAGSAWHEPESGNPWGGGHLTPAQCWQARVYFHPFVRRFLYDPQRVRWLQRTDVARLQVVLPVARGFAAATITLKVERCLMALFQPDIACLLLELDYCATEGQPALTMDQLQRLLDRLRRTYPPYFDTDDKGKPIGGHSPMSVTLLDQNGQAISVAGSYTPDAYANSLADAVKAGRWKPGWAAHWKALLHPLNPDATPQDGWGIRQFGDDRAAIMSYVAFNDVRALNRGQWVRLCFADDHGNDPLPYAERFLTDFEAKHCYDRYWYTGPSGDAVPDSRDNPSRILNCGYALTYAGKSGDWFFERDPTGALFTFRHIYVFMGLIAHMQRAALLAASYRLTHMVERKGSQITLPDREEVREFYDQFVEFTQTYWFDEITPQEQGQQIFDQWQKHLRIQPLYDEVRQELRDLAEYSELRAGAEQNDQAVQLNEAVGVLGAASVILAMLSLIAGILGMNDPASIWGWLALPTGILFTLLALLLYRLYRVRNQLFESIPTIGHLLSRTSSQKRETKP